LLIATGACAIHCRYCFRRHYPYGQDNAVRHWDGMLQRLRERPHIDEVILSGGDPLSLSDARLAQLIAELDKIAHLRRLRIHTRMPVILPARITPGLTGLLRDSRLQTSMVLHCNHPNELAEPLRAPMERLREACVTLLNQAVLLAGVNDKLETQISLSEQLFEFGILPYYLHLLDPVAGAAHFSVPHELPDRIGQGLEAALPGYLVPKLVREIPGQASKTPLHRL
jgi:EF-P beta-lysylation protein EpmB